METLRVERTAFLNGAPRESQLGRMLVGAQLCIIHVVCRAMEKEHRTVNQRVTSTRHGSVLISLSRRLLNKESELAQDPKRLGSMIENFEVARQPRVLV